MCDNRTTRDHADDDLRWVLTTGAERSAVSAACEMLSPGAPLGLRSLRNACAFAEPASVPARAHVPEVA